MSWTSAIGLGARLEEAVAEAADQVDTARGQAHDLAVAFVSAAYGTAVERLPQLLRPVVGDCLLFGCNAGGLIGGGSEEENEPGIALLCGRLPDAVLEAAHLEQSTLPPLSASRESWWRMLDLGPESEPSFLMLADPATIDAEACARGLDRAFPGSTVIGGLTAGMLAPGTARLVTGSEVHRTGAALLALSTHSAADVVAASDEPLDYLGFGPVHATATKGYARGLGSEVVGEVQARDVGVGIVVDLAEVRAAAVFGAVRTGRCKSNGRAIRGMAILSPAGHFEDGLQPQHLSVKSFRFVEVLHVVPRQHEFQFHSAPGCGSGAMTKASRKSAKRLDSRCLACGSEDL